MNPFFRCLFAVLLCLAAMPASAMEVSINGSVEDLVVENCDGLEVAVFDTLSVFGFRQETYTVFLNGSAVDSEVMTLVGAGNQSFGLNFTVPTVPGAYHVERSGLGTGSSWVINVSLAQGLECDPPMRVTSFGGNMWFGGRDWSHRPVVGDFDNDGHIDDITYRGKCGTGTECWRMHRGNVSSFSTSNFGGNMWFQGGDAPNTPVSGDFDNDGYIDDIAYWGKCGSGYDCWRVHLSNGSWFSTANFGGNMWFGGSSAAHAPVVGDFDNDGFIDDIAYNGKCGSGSGYDCWRVHLSNGSSFTSANFGGGMWFQGSSSVHTPIVADFDNDGFVDDIVYWGLCGSGSGSNCWRAHVSNGSSFASANGGAGMWFGGSSAKHMPLAAEIDNDGHYDDIIYLGKCGGGYDTWRRHLSNGSSLSTACTVGPTGAWFEGSVAKNAPVVGDFDNDGERDDIAYYGKCGSGSDCWRVPSLALSCSLVLLNGRIAASAAVLFSLAGMTGHPHRRLSTQSPLSRLSIPHGCRQSGWTKALKIDIFEFCEMLWQHHRNLHCNSRSPCSAR